MKRMLSLAAMVMLISVPTLLFAQAGTLNIYASQGNLNDIIEADTLANGAQAHAVYRLVSRDTTYKFTGTITSTSDITVLGVLDPVTGRPPCIQPAVLQDGSLPSTIFTLNGKGINGKFQNLYLLALATNNTATGAGIAIQVSADNVRLSVDNCVFDGWQSFAIGYNGQWDKFFVTNSHFRNMVHPNQWYIGEVIRNEWPGEAYTDTMSFVGNTMLCINGYAAAPVTKWYTKYFEFSNNKVVYTFKNPFFIFNVTDGKINNNIFYGNYSGGVDQTENPWWDNLWSPDTTYGVIAFQALSTDNAAMFNPANPALAEGLRRIEVKNNVYFWPKTITDFWANWNATQTNKIKTPSFMNEPTKAMFADKAKYPYLVESGNVNQDPGFKPLIDANILNGTTGNDIGFLKYFEQIRSGTAATDVWGFGITQVGTAADWKPAWPLPEAGLLEKAFTITVDGNKDAFYETLAGPNDGYLQLKYYGGNDNGNPYNNADLSAKVWTAWDSDWFYLYEEVMDDTLAANATNVWEEDEIELKFDPQPTDSVTNSVWDTRLTVLRPGTGVVAGDSLNNITDAALKQWARKIIPGGYALELAIKWSAIRSGTETITPAAGNVFGMAINNHDNDGRARRQASIMWAAVMLDAVWNTPKYHGTVKFLPDNKLQFIPQNNVTKRANPIPYDGTPFFVAVDGIKDRVYTALRGPNDGYLQIRSYANNDNGLPVNDADLSAKVWTAWDDTWFYLYEEVRDDTLAANATNVWEEDELELKFDPQPTDSVTNSVWDTRLTILRPGTGVVAGDSLNNITDASLKKWARIKITGGYALELAIKWSVIRSGTETITPAANSIFGMAINQHDNDGRARRQASIMWAAVMRDAVWNTPKYHGTVKFLPDNKLQFIARNNMTGRTNIIPYDGSNWAPPTGVEEKDIAELPLEYSLSQNYPNPFNPATQIRYSLKEGVQVSLRIYNVMGNLVATLVDQKQSPGNYGVFWDGRDRQGKLVSTGIYFYKIQAGSFTQIRKMALVK